MSQLLQIIDVAFADSARRSGAHLACKPGCTQCCVGVFPISQQDAARLRNGLTALTHTDTERAERIRSRVAASFERLDPGFPGERESGILAQDYEDSLLFDDFANDETCPVLDPKTGLCDLYEYRPVTCRTFGPPMRTAENDLATCELCYITASTEEIAAAELNPAIPEMELRSNESYNSEHHVQGETLVAYSLRKC